MRDIIASLLGVDELTLSAITIRIASVSWWLLSVAAEALWKVAVWTGRAIESNSHRVHEWASMGRHALGNINANSGNMIRHARNSLHPVDKIAMVVSLVVGLVFAPYGLAIPIGTYLVFFKDADALKASSTVAGYVGICVSAVLNVMLFAASFVSSNRWRKQQFRD